jgi:hypothetical protein
MATETRELRIKARKLGATNVREMDRNELKEFIAEHKNSNGSKKVSKKAALKAVKTGGKVKRGPGRPRKVVDEDEDDEEEAPRRRGRPAGSKNKKNTTAVKRGRPAKSEKRGKATKRRSGGPGRPAGSGTGTRVLLSDRINWDKNFDFREGTTQNYILAQIRKVAAKTKDTAEIREKVFDRLVDKIGDRDELTFQNRSTGKPWKGEAAENRLKYYISRTMFDYAVNTGQHEGSGDSAASQPRNGNGASTKKTAKRGRPRKVVEDDDDDDDDDDEDEAPRRRGRPKGSKNKKNTKAKTTTGKKRGRPPGSKNKVVSGTGKKRGRPPGSKNKKLKVRG